MFLVHMLGQFILTLNWLSAMDLVDPGTNETSHN